jgi:hypothetical protein
LVQRIKKEKKEREQNMNEKFKKADQRIANEISERARIAEAKENEEKM